MKPQNNIPGTGLIQFFSVSLAIAVSIGYPTRLWAETKPSGTIREDTDWSGDVVIAGDVTIDAGTVRVAAGSTIRFVADGAAGTGPVLRLNCSLLKVDRQSIAARLILDGTADNPIIVESPEGKPPGSIIAGPGTSGSLVARHVIFRRLGMPVSARQYNPAIIVQLALSGDNFGFTDCQFKQCGPVRGEFFGVDAGAAITRCTFSDTLGDIALILSGIGSGVKVVTSNISDAAFRIECPQVLLQDNVLIGEAANICIPTVTPEAITIESNYIHCRTRKDQGRYVLKCDAPQVVVTRNVLMGGTYVIETAPRTVTGNVLIGADGLEATFNVPGVDVQSLKSTTCTHYLITNLAEEAVIADNLFLGPAYAALSTGKSADRPRIEHNIFDGWNTARRAIHFNIWSQKPIAATLTGNIITRYRLSPICDDAQLQGTLANVGNNLFAEVVEPLYDKIPNLPFLAEGDRRLDRFDQIGFNLPQATRFADNIETKLMDRRIAVAKVRDLWFDAYRPGSGSPLVTTNKDNPIGPRRQK